jgi:hypothetical protein
VIDTLGNVMKNPAFSAATSAIPANIAGFSPAVPVELVESRVWLLVGLHQPA